VEAELEAEALLEAPLPDVLLLDTVPEALEVEALAEAELDPATLPELVALVLLPVVVELAALVCPDVRGLEPDPLVWPEEQTSFAHVSPLAHVVRSQQGSPAPPQLTQTEPPQVSPLVHAPPLQHGSPAAPQLTVASGFPASLVAELSPPRFAQLAASPVARISVAVAAGVCFMESPLPR
jgi:hypothetical protein